MPGGELLELITVLPATSGALPASAGSGARVSAVNVITGRTGQARSRLHFSPGVDGVDVVVGAPVSPGVLAGCGVVCQSTRNKNPPATFARPTMTTITTSKLAQRRRGVGAKLGSTPALLAHWLQQRHKWQGPFTLASSMDMWRAWKLRMSWNIAAQAGPSSDLAALAPCRQTPRLAIPYLFVARLVFSN